MHVEKTKRLIIWNGGIICRFVVVGGDDSEVLYGSRTGLQMVWQRLEVVVHVFGMLSVEVLGVAAL